MPPPLWAAQKAGHLSSLLVFSTLGAACGNPYWRLHLPTFLHRQPWLLPLHPMRRTGARLSLHFQEHPNVAITDLRLFLSRGDVEWTPVATTPETPEPSCAGLGACPAQGAHHSPSAQHARDTAYPTSRAQQQPRPPVASPGRAEAPVRRRPGSPFPYPTFINTFQNSEVPGERKEGQAGAQVSPQK